MSLDFGNGKSLLVDTNLLVLFAVGSVNRSRVENFKRTRQYTVADFDLLLRFLSGWAILYTVPHVLAEVNTLTDLPGAERPRIRHLLKQTIAVLNEEYVSSFHAADDGVYERLGLTDAAILVAARKHRCLVLTDDLDLYLVLESEKIDVINFTHLRAQAFAS